MRNSLLNPIWRCTLSYSNDRPIYTFEERYANWSEEDLECKEHWKPNSYEGHGRLRGQYFRKGL